MKSLQDAQQGCFLGLAIGDALGAAVEFEPPGTFPPVTGFRAGGPHGINAGEWTDDTSMALALADSIANGPWDLNDQARRYLSWYRKGMYSVNGRCFDIGLTTRGALTQFEHTGDANTSGDTADAASGNGSIMRLAPVPIRFVDAPFDKVARLAAESSLPTHGSSQCLAACRYLAVVLVGLMRGLPRDEVLAADWQPVAELRNGGLLHRKIDEVVSGSYRAKNTSIVGSGYVTKSLEAALWAFYNAKTFELAVLKAVNLGKDADTTGAICGQLAGAYWGRSGIPEPLLHGLAQREIIEHVVAALTQARTA